MLCALRMWLSLYQELAMLGLKKCHVSKIPNGLILKFFWDESKHRLHPKKQLSTDGAFF